MFKNIEAVAFDIDGTLYPSWALFWQNGFYFIKNSPFYLRFGLTRKILRRSAPVADFFEYQARLVKNEKETVQEIKTRLWDTCYAGIEESFKKIRPFPGMFEAIKDMKAAGLKIAILSDFPPSQKGDIWGVRDLCDVCLGAEEIGALKPSIYPFKYLAQKLGVAPEKVLYVGNSRKYDVGGANQSGMKSAYILTGVRKLFNLKLREADISFRNFRQLRDIVLNQE